MTTTMRSRDDVLAELRDVSTRRTAARDADRALYAQQVALYIEAREGVDPPVLLKEIAEASGSSVVAVDAAIAKHHGRRGGR